MNILDIYRYFRNYITVSISGGFTERFINLCNRENVYLWDFIYRDGELTVKLYCKDFKRLIKIKRKSGVKINIVKKSGITFYIKENKNRKVLVAGLTIALILMLIMNSFVWSIEIIGTELTEKNEIIETLKRAGLKYGTFVPVFDEFKASREAVNLSDGKLLWLAVNIKGSKATVEVRDHIKPKYQASDNSPCNILADFEGVILSVYTHSGVQIANEGTAVKKGDLIISGIVESENSTDYLCADGEIVAKHEKTLKGEFNDKIKSDISNCLKNGYILKFFGIDIPLFIKPAENDNTFSYTEYITFDNKTIPIGFEKNVTIHNESTEKTNCSFLEKIDLFTKREYSELKNSKIINVDYSISKQIGQSIITGLYDCIDFMGEKSLILKEN